MSVFGILCFYKQKKFISIKDFNSLIKVFLFIKLIGVPLLIVANLQAFSIFCSLSFLIYIFLIYQKIYRQKKEFQNWKICFLQSILTHLRLGAGLQIALRRSVDESPVRVKEKLENLLEILKNLQNKSYIPRDSFAKKLYFILLNSNQCVDQIERWVFVLKNQKLYKNKAQTQLTQFRLQQLIISALYFLMFGLLMKSGKLNLKLFSLQLSLMLMALGYLFSKYILSKYKWRL